MSLPKVVTSVCLCEVSSIVNKNLSNGYLIDTRLHIVKKRNLFLIESPVAVVENIIKRVGGSFDAFF